MKVALYARMATQRQGDDGAASQIEVLRAYANEQGFEVTETYVGCDPNHSGATLDRPGLNRLRCGAEAKAFDAVLILTPDRLSRNCRDWIHIIEQFERWAVRRGLPSGSYSTLPTLVGSAILRCQVKVKNGWFCGADQALRLTRISI